MFLNEFGSLENDIARILHCEKLPKAYPEIMSEDVVVIYVGNEVTIFSEAFLGHIFYDKCAHAKMMLRMDKGSHFEELFIKEK